MNAALLTSLIPEDPTGWLVSEKFDGIRAIWDGDDFVTRHGKVLNAPAWFKAGMPAERLDGELWMGRGTFDALRSSIQTKGSNWEGVRFMVFETCDMEKPIEERLRDLRELTLPEHCPIVRHTACGGVEDLATHEGMVVDGEGEGLVIRRPGSKYRPGRCGDVVKVKRLVEDVDRWQG